MVHPAVDDNRLTMYFDTISVSELALNPTCIKVCTREEYNLRKSGKKLTMPKMPLPYGHGKIMYAVKVSAPTCLVFCSPSTN